MDEEQKQWEIASIHDIMSWERWNPDLAFKFGIIVGGFSIAFVIWFIQNVFGCGC